jgi:hypothetical protein
MKARPPRFSALLVTSTGALLACTSHPGLKASADAGVDAPTYDGGFQRDVLIDSQNCRGCHPNQYAEWSRSVHAHASDDPVFIAMNKRGQRETHGQLGDFCVKCHAPQAVHDGQTMDGLNLADVDPKYKGVTCFFCHSVSSVTGTHNAALGQSDDLVMRGEYSDAISNPAHPSAQSGLFDRDLQDSATMCGSCHDIIVDRTGAFIERTSCEWSHSAFNAPYVSGGLSCVTCHMPESSGPIANFANVPVRQYHQHDFPAVDTPLDVPSDVETMAVQQFLANTLYGALCVTEGGGIRVILDPVLTGHNFPSGAAQDRRLWAEVIAYSAGNVIYQSGVVPDGKSVVDVDPKVDPDLWLLRDQMFDMKGSPVSMFWQAVTTQGNEIPALATFDKRDPNSPYYRTHVMQLYPRSAPGMPQPLSQQPDRVTLRMRLQPVGLDVLNDLVDSGDLDPNVRASMPTYDVSFVAPDGGVVPMLEWAGAASATVPPYQDEKDMTSATCVTTNTFDPSAPKVVAPEMSAATDCSDGGAEDAAIIADAGSADADGGVVCDPRFAPDNIVPGLTKTGNAGAFKFVLMSPTPEPPGVGFDTWVVKVLDNQGRPVTNASFTKPDGTPGILPWMPLHGHGSSYRPTWTSNGDGTYSLKFNLIMPGVWTVTLTAQAGTTTDTVVFALCVGG